ncbi:MAG: hypothetical protein QOD92_4397 [Acidimicrobiaceae bacterium]|jgi:hypothetical protein
MSGWLADVLGGYLDNVTEREFDATFLTLLRATQFHDIHQLHGAYEFGKDFIAKRDGQQWAFQTKAGDINMASWRQVRPQVEEMLWNDTAHPAFDVVAKRKPVLVTTGRLVGGAAAEAQQYATTLAKRSAPRGLLATLFRRGVEPAFEVWDRETLLAALALQPDISFNGWDEAHLLNLLGLLADIGRRNVSARTYERTSRQWPRSDLPRTALATALAAHRLQEANRLDLACVAVLTLTRAAAVELHDGPGDNAEETMDVARTLFDTYSTSLMGQAEPLMADPKQLFGASNELLGSVTYPIRCSVLCESMGMLGLLRQEQQRQEDAAVIAESLAAFVSAQPGASHPISDRWAASLVPSAILLHRYQPDALVPWLELVVAWICDHHFRAPGLASVSSDPADEIRQLLGDPYDHVEVDKRTQSLLATTVLDLASCLELPDFFRDAFNDFAAVDIAFPVLEPLDEEGQYWIGDTGVIGEPNVAFDEHHDFAFGWTTGVHHRRAPKDYALQRAGRTWELLAIGTLLRDRHFLPATRELAGFAVPA